MIRINTMVKVKVVKLFYNDLVQDEEGRVMIPRYLPWSGGSVSLVVIVVEASISRLCLDSSVSLMRPAIAMRLLLTSILEAGPVCTEIIYESLERL